MEELSDKLAEIVDRAAIEAVLIRYANANDTDDWDGMAECFAADGVMESAGTVRFEGRDALRETFAKIPALAHTMMPLDRVMGRQHVVSNVEIALDGDKAKSFCGTIAYILGERDGEGVILVRGLNYTDSFVRSDEGWRIQNRRHQLLWMYETTPIDVDKHRG